jgi:hypothetical protein
MDFSSGTGQNQKCIAACTEVVREDPNSRKAYFRRGQVNPFPNPRSRDPRKIPFQNRTFGSIPKSVTTAGNKLSDEAMNTLSESYVYTIADLKWVTHFKSAAE